MKQIERITHGDKLLAIVVRHDFHRDGIEFFTPGELSQQLAYMNRPKGYVIPAHIHNKVVRNVVYTQETLVIKSGSVRVDLYDNDCEYVSSRTLGAGDVILLAGGGHGFEMLERTEMIEIKQGPYVGDSDKTCFEPGGR